MPKEYKSLIFTNHGLERMDSRSISQWMVWQTVEHPETKTKDGKGTVKFIATVKGRRLHVVAQRLDKERKWLVISTWVRGEEDQLPLAWRVITFPFWLVWKIITMIWKMIFSRSST